MFTDKALENVPRSKIRDQLMEVGFDDERQAETVGGLSGGWKMKLELARAMLYNADLLLLDEVSFLLCEPIFFNLACAHQAYQSCKCKITFSLTLFIYTTILVGSRVC